MRARDNLLTRQARQAFEAGKFETAHQLYTELAERLGSHLYRANLDACKRKIQLLARNNNSETVAPFVAVNGLEKELLLTANNLVSAATITLGTPPAAVQISTKQLGGERLIRSRKHAVALFDFLDADGNKISEVGGLGVSRVFGKHFQYLGHEDVDRLTNSSVFSVSITPPSQAAKVQIYFAGLASLGTSAAQVLITARTRPKSQAAYSSSKSQFALPTPKIYDPHNTRKTSDLVIPCILDEFTHECLSHSANIKPLSVHTWEDELACMTPDFLLVESCWKGNCGEWGTLSKGSGGGKKLSGLLKHCKLKEIPTVFWNKEDPPHYERFAPVASMFDLVITSDIDMLTRYRKDYNISAIALPFAAEPKIHNPRPQTRRLNRAVFAGSYYRDKPKRCEDFNSLMQCIEMSGLEYDIYDRNYSSDLEKFAFPEHFQKSIVGTLQPHEIYKAHKGYKYQLNINTVQSSATMFARRVFESLACGTPVISNDSVGMNILFEDIPIVVNTEAPDRLKDLESSYTLYTDLARRGVRKVMNEHTYSHRLKTICDRLGINIEVETPEAVLSIIATNDQDIVIAKSIFNRQTASNKRLFIELENFDNSYQYLNQCDGNTTFALRGAKDLYDKKETYYGSGNVFHHDLIAPLEATDLEDFLYWGHLGTSSFPFEVNELGDSHND